MHRIALLAAAVLVVLMSAAAIPLSATEYPWCARYGDDHGGTNCGFSTVAQCVAAVSGNAGICDRNLFYFEPTVAPRARKPSPKRG